MQWNTQRRWGKKEGQSGQNRGREAEEWGCVFACVFARLNPGTERSWKSSQTACLTPWE